MTVLVTDRLSTTAELPSVPGDVAERDLTIASDVGRELASKRVATIADELNNPLGALSSTVRCLERLGVKLPEDIRGEHSRLLSRLVLIARRIELRVAAIVSENRTKVKS